MSNTVYSRASLTQDLNTWRNIFSMFLYVCVCVCVLVIYLFQLNYYYYNIHVVIIIFIISIVDMKRVGNFLAIFQEYSFEII